LTFHRLRTSHPRLLGAIVAALWLGTQLIEHDLGLLLLFLPVAALFAALLMGRTPGEALLTRLREARTPKRPRRHLSPSTARREDRRHISGGTLLARRLAGRAPPLAALTTA
jgi:hypothetical protein